jgi:preprotein translocase subunit SecD
MEISGSKDKLDSLLSQKYPNLQELSASEQGGFWKVTLVLDSREVEFARKRAIDQALEIIRNRVDQFGVSEPEITLQGTERILIQLPGSDAQRAQSDNTDGAPGVQAGR